MDSKSLSCKNYNSKDCPIECDPITCERFEIKRTVTNKRIV